MFEHFFKKDKTCRTCAKTDIELSSLFTKQDSEDGICFSDMITQCTIYTVKENDELPQLICFECKDKLKTAFDFKKQCEDSHRRFLTMIQSMNEAKREEDKACNSSTDDEKEKNNNLRKKSSGTVSSKFFCQQCDDNFDNLLQLKEHVKTTHRLNCPGCSKEFIRLGHLKRHVKKVHADLNQKKTIEKIFVKTGSEPPIKEEEIALPDTSKAESGMVIVPDITLLGPSKDESDAEDVNFDFGADNYDDSSFHAEPDSKPVKDEVEATDSKTITSEVTAKDEEKNEEEVVDKKDESIINDVKDSPVKSKNGSPRTHVDANRRFECDQCHKSFKRKSHLKQHTLCHSKVKSYQCTICQKRFGRPDNLKVHMSNHGQKHFQCNSCDRSFGQAYLLKRHKDQTHSEEKPFLCSECGQRFVRNGDLAVHMRRHTGEKPYKCQYCNKGFTRSTEVYVHERYHTGEKRHVCSICGKAFQRPYNLLVHVRTHTGERPYQCPHCPKNFAQCSDLKAHIRRHTGERYKCDQCGMGFIHVFVLNQHKLTVHGIEVQSRIKRITKPSTDT